MRLIDADALWKEFDTAHLFDNGNPRHIAQQAVEDAPTVDIKTEVAREIFEDIKSSYKDRIFVDIEELENKYTKEITK